LIFATGQSVTLLGLSQTNSVVNIIKRKNFKILDYLYITDDKRIIKASKGLRNSIRKKIKCSDFQLSLQKTEEKEDGI